MIGREDYEEPRCPLCTPAPGERIPLRRILSKLDGYFADRDFAGAERHLSYWFREAEALGDAEGALALANEEIGLARKTENEKKAIDACARALSLVSSLGLSDTVAGATAYLNIATAKKAFGRAGEALPLALDAKRIYERDLKEDDRRLGGLYNNAGLILLDLSRYGEAEDFFLRAISVMERHPDTAGEIAVTLCNLADLAEARDGAEGAEKTVSDLLGRAYALLSSIGGDPSPENAYFLEKCAPVFGYYGFFLREAALEKKAKELYERS